MYKLQKIDELCLNQYPRLKKADECYFFGEYHSKQGYQHSDFNQIMFNFKKPMEKRNDHDWQYKEIAIHQMTDMIYQCPQWPTLNKYLWIPIPPSKTEGHPDHDNRMIRILENLKNKDCKFNYSNCISQKTDRDPVHLSEKKRPTSEEHFDNFIFNQKIIIQASDIIIFDDLITTGSSFAAMKQILLNKFPETSIIGLFLGRSVH